MNRHQHRQAGGVVDGPYADLDFDPDEEERAHDLELAANGGRVIPLAEYPPAGDAGATPELLAGLRTGDWLDAQTFPPLAYAIPGIVAEGLTFNAGPPKIGKSWELLDFALALSCGGVALGHIRVGNPRPVLYLALEDGDRRMQDRCRKLLDGGPIPSGFQYMTRVDRGRVLDTAREWLGQYPDGRPVLLLDTLGKVMPPAAYGESPYDRDYRVGNALKALADEVEGASVIVNHHDRKASSDDFIHAISGTNGLAGAADTIVVIARRRHQPDGTIQVTGRDVAEGEYALTFKDGCQWELKGGTLEAAAAQAEKARATSRISDRSIEVMAFVDSHPQGVTPKAASEALNLPDARKYLTRLHESGRIGKTARGIYVPIVTVSQSDEGMGHGDTWDTDL
jgi:hypothetical protein